VASAVRVVLEEEVINAVDVEESVRVVDPGVGHRVMDLGRTAPKKNDITDGVQS
jgi:hypothetical protein